MPYLERGRDNIRKMANDLIGPDWTTFFKPEFELSLTPGTIEYRIMLACGKIWSFKPDKMYNHPKCGAKVCAIDPLPKRAKGNAIRQHNVKLFHRWLAGELTEKKARNQPKGGVIPHLNLYKLKA